jgi:hypothetical protein
MTVDELIDKLVDLPSDHIVCMTVAGKYSEDFTVSTTQDDYVMLADNTWIEESSG